MSPISLTRKSARQRATLAKTKLTLKYFSTSKPNNFTLLLTEKPSSF